MVAVNNTRKKIQKTAEENLKQKISLEKSLIKDLNKYFDQLAEDYKVVYGATGRILTLNESYEEELTSLLKKNYRDVSSRFSSLTQDAIEDEIDLDLYEVNQDEKNNLVKNIALAVGAYILLRAKNISPKIAKTTQEVLSEETNKFIIEKASSGIAVTNAEIANAVSKKIKDWGKEHSQTVATTEVQSVSEKSKRIENQEIVKNLKEYEGEIDIPKGSKKVWITAGDERVRESHSILNGVTIQQDELFRTGNGSPMQYAGDMENGAVLSDVINCRCSTIYRYDTDVIKVYTNKIFRRKL